MWRARYSLASEALYIALNVVYNPTMIALGISLVGLALISFYTYAVIKRRDNL
jgi:hypothetical protein